MVHYNGPYSTRFKDDYLRSLATTWKRISDEAKKQGLIVSYKVLSANASDPDDWDLLLIVELKNWAAVDGIADKFEPISQKVVGGDDAHRQLATKRLEIRRILGSKNAQELLRWGTDWRRGKETRDKALKPC